MTENKSAMERLRETLRRYADTEYGVRPVWVDSAVIDAARAVLAEHDAIMHRDDWAMRMGAAVKAYAAKAGAANASKTVESYLGKGGSFDAAVATDALIREIVTRVNAAESKLAEHDAAQKVPPSEAAKAWRKRDSDCWREDVVATVAAMNDDPGSESRWKRFQELLDEAVHRMSQPAEAPKRLRAGWRGDAVNAISRYANSWGRASHAEQCDAWSKIVDPILDEAESSSAPAPTEQPKRMRPEWGDEVRYATKGFSDPGVDRKASLLEFGMAAGKHWDDLQRLIAEAEQSAAPEPEQRTKEQVCHSHEVRALQRTIDSRDATIDALTRALLAAQGRQP